MNRTSAPSGFTLVETIAVMVVLGVISAVLSSVLYTATDAYSIAETQRRSMDEIGFAMEKITRLIREEPALSSDPGSSGLTEAGVSLLRFESGLRIELVGDAIEIEIPGQGEAVLLRDVDSCTFTLYPDGPGDVDPIDLGSGQSPAPARLIECRIESGPYILTTRVLLRSAYGTGS